MRHSLKEPAQVKVSRSSISDRQLNLPLLFQLGKAPFNSGSRLSLIGGDNSSFKSFRFVHLAKSVFARFEL
jgi:hypothetical protein